MPATNKFLRILPKRHLEESLCANVQPDVKLANAFKLTVTKP